MRIAAVLGLIGLLCFAAAPARASGGLTGTYAGTLTCRLAGGSVTVAPSLLAISERAASPEGVRLFVEIDGTGYAGRAADGDAAFTSCGAINAGYGDRANPLEKVTYAPDPTTGALVLHLAARAEFGTCEATWTRIDASEPGISACGQ